MPTSDRHHAALSSATDTYRATPVGPSALPPLSTHSLDAERARLAREVDRVVAVRGAVQTSIEEAEAEVARAVSEAGAADADALRLRERQDRLAAEAHAAEQRLAQAEERRIGLTSSIAGTQDRIDALRVICDGLGETLATVSGGSLTPSQIAGTAEDLDRVAERCIAVGDEAAASVLSSWSAALRSDTAAVHPSATALLEALGDLERRWDEHGRGDLMADPAVAALRSVLDDARALQDEIESQASSGALGDRTLRTIREAHARRTELEDRNNKAEVDELRAAIEAETEALRVVGFDSMLDLHIATSTGGTGTLVEAQRARAASRVAELESELAMLLARTVALHAELQVSFDQLRSRADELVGGLSDRPLVQALEGLLAVPDGVPPALAGLEDALQSSVQQLETDRGELDQLGVETPALDLRSAVATADVGRAAAEVAAAELACGAAAAAIADRERALELVRLDAAASDAEVTAATAAVEALAALRYLEEDRAQYSRALIATLVEHATWLASGAGSEDGTSATAMVVDDPLGDLADSDAVVVIDEMVAVTWPLPVVFVTSRAPLVLRLRQDAGHLVCIDGRRRPRASRRWSRRSADAGGSLHT